MKSFSNVKSFSSFTNSLISFLEYLAPLRSANFFSNLTNFSLDILLFSSILTSSKKYFFPASILNTNLKELLVSFNSAKEFKTLNYSGDLGWAVVEDILTDIEDGHVGNSFKNINNKHYDYIKGGKNPSSPTSPPNWTNAGSPFSGSIHADGQIDFSGKNVFGVGSINSTFLKEGDTALQTNKVQFFIKSDNSETSLAAQSNTLGVGIYAPSGSSSGILVSNSYSGNL